MIRYEKILREHIEGIISLCQVEGYTSYTEDEDLTWRVLSAPGITTFVAVDGDDVVGFIQMQSDGYIQAHISNIVVASNHRRQGIGRRLVEEAFTHAGGKRIDLITEGADDFFHSFWHQDRWRGYRIYPEINDRSI